MRWKYLLVVWLWLCAGGSHAISQMPLFVKDRVDGQYDFLPAAQAGQSSYLSFLQRKKARPGLVFAGADDGMLRVFSEIDGRERFAFVPNTGLDRRSALSRRPCAPPQLADGTLAEFDVYDSANGRWRNIVVGSGGAGARNLFALNVPVADTATSPATAAMGAADVLWEVNSAMDDFAEMGYLPQRAEAGLMRDGSWVVIVGNGYESPSAKAQLFVIDALTGRRLAVLDTGVGSASQRNGLGAVRVLRDAQRRVVAAYAGDLHGHLWKFDFSSASRSDWKVAFGTANGARTPFFKATNAQGAAEPITAAPALMRHPGGGVMAMFGTGKLIDESDPASTAQRSLYGLWDRVAVGADSSGADGALADASALVTQEVLPLAPGGSASSRYHAVSRHIVDYGAGAGKRGWRLRLTIQPGQRLIDDPTLAKGRVIFDTLVPIASGPACTRAGARAYTFVLDPFTGGAAADGPTLDTDGDGRFTVADNPAAAVFASDGVSRRAIASAAGRDLVSIGGGGRGTGGSSSANGSNGDSVGNGSGGGDASEERIQGSRNAVTRHWNQIIHIPR